MYKVIIVDDESIIQQGVKTLIDWNELNCTISKTCKNGREALEKFLSQGDLYDLILMDVQMPVMDGYQATEAIRRSGRPRAQTIPIIAMTADAFHEDVVQALATGMDGHISKSIDPNLLYQTLADMLSKND